MTDIEWMIILILIGFWFAAIFFGAGVIVGGCIKGINKDESAIHNNDRNNATRITNFNNSDVGDDLK